MKIIFMILLCLVLSGLNTAEATGLRLNRQSDPGHLQPTYLADLPDNMVYFNIGQGFTYGRLLDQRMSNLHYTGPGMILSFSRYAENEHYRSELKFAGIGFQILQPLHKGTTVNNPFFGVRYSHLRKLNVRSFADFYVGGQVETSANIRLAPVLSNSYLYADIMGTLQPRFDVSHAVILFDRELKFDLCAEMLYELRDGHVNLSSSFDRSRYWEWYLNSPENFFFSIIEREYLRGRQRFIGPLIVAPIGEQDNILYVYYGSFGNFVSDGNLDNLIQIINNMEDIRGVIIDVRNNGGGSPENGRKIAARFTEERVFAGVNYLKNGPGHDDFREEEVFIDPHDGLRYSGPVAVLTNRKSYSATTYFAQYMKAIESTTLIGDTTGGGGGIPAFWDLPNGWLLRVSSSRFYTPEGESIEPGVPPHIPAEIPVTDDHISLKKDNIIETAIEFLLNAQL